MTSDGCRGGGEKYREHREGTDEKEEVVEAERRGGGTTPRRRDAPLDANSKLLG